MDIPTLTGFFKYAEARVKDAEREFRDAWRREESELLHPCNTEDCEKAITVRRIAQKEFEAAQFLYVMAQGFIELGAPKDDSVDLCAECKGPKHFLLSCPEQKD